ncbi:hypothetical protein KIL84_013985 [Mauremys mutica]|uniref:Uncharacterized protein n=1 Tax=Mauremys mutica TaxID=74926 RepID=A0A9D4AUW1_9SAUR|nr:hypothetical protein KIL84_013985 [Mauremys mutica]
MNTAESHDFGRHFLDDTKQSRRNSSFRDWTESVSVGKQHFARQGSQQEGGEEGRALECLRDQVSPREERQLRREGRCLSTRKRPRQGERSQHPSGKPAGKKLFSLPRGLLCAS